MLPKEATEYDIVASGFDDFITRLCIFFEAYRDDFTDDHQEHWDGYIEELQTCDMRRALHIKRLLLEIINEEAPRGWKLVNDHCSTIFYFWEETC